MPKQKIRCLYITFNGLMDPLGQSQILPYIEGLSEKGIKFYLISLEKRRSFEEIKKTKHRLECIGVNWYKLRYFGNYPIKIFFSILQCSFLAFYILLTKKIDIIHTRSYYPTFSIIFLKKVFRTKVIFDMRGFWPEELVDSGRIEKKSIYYKLLKFFEKKSILRADFLITLTPEAIKIIKSNYQDKKIKIIWMPTCVDEKRFETKDSIFSSDKFLMIYSGSLWSHYDFEAMIDFFNVLKKKVAGARFLILGNNQTEKLYPLLSRKGLRKEEYIILTVKQSEVPKYLKAARLGISFLYETSSKKGSFPTKIAEYLMSGLPVVITTQCSFLKKIITLNKIGFVIENFDEENYQEVTEKLHFLLQDKDIKERCKKIAKKYFVKDVCVEKYLKVYKELSS